MSATNESDRNDGSITEQLEECALSEGQRRRLSLLETVEAELCERVGRICVTSNVDVSDVAVLVVARAALPFLFAVPRPVHDGMGTGALLACHREELYAFLAALLPAAPGECSGDPYADLLEPAPPQCARVLVIDHESLTILSYGSFVVVRADRSGMPTA